MAHSIPAFLSLAEFIPRQLPTVPGLPPFPTPVSQPQGKENSSFSVFLQSPGVDRNLRPSWSNVPFSEPHPASMNLGEGAEGGNCNKKKGRGRQTPSVLTVVC